MVELVGVSSVKIIPVNSVCTKEAVYSVSNFIIPLSQLWLWDGKLKADWACLICSWCRGVGVELVAACKWDV